MSMLDRLDRRDRMRLMRFVCSFAWADLEVRPEEREFVRAMVARLALDDDERKKVQCWLDHPPELESVDPTLVPAAHRRVGAYALPVTAARYLRSWSMCDRSWPACINRFLSRDSRPRSL